MEERDRSFWAREEAPAQVGDGGSVGTFARVNGATIPLDPGASFKDTCLRLSRDAGFGKFRVFLNGTEIKPSEAPDVVSEGMALEVRAFDVAGV
jgi:hypothetical protein